jgi:uncharacterized protein (TIGR03435 family)
MRWKRLGALAAAAAGIAQEQPGAGPQPVFEVASVKVAGAQSKRRSSGGPGTSDPGQYHYNSATLLDLIAIAYHVQHFQIASKAALDRGTFDVVAKVPAGATRDQFRAMMQNLLAERFHLKLHRESREFPAWELIVGKSGSKLKESSVDAGAESMSGPLKYGDDGFPLLAPNTPGWASTLTIVDGFIVGRMAAQRQPVSVLTGSFGMGDDPPILDHTGLTGKYDFRLEFSREPTGAPAAEAKTPPVPDLFTAVQQQLGLQLVSKRLPFDVLVVESVDRVPTEN